MNSNLVSLNTEVRPATTGGTGQSSYLVGDLLYAATTTTLAKLAAVISGKVLVSAGTNTAPAWSATPTLTSLVLGALSGSPAQATLYKESIVRAWARFDGTGTPALTQSFNVASITDNGTGDWTLVYTTGLVEATPCVIATALQPYYGCFHSANGSGARVQARDAAGSLTDVSDMMVVVFGV